MKKNTTNNINHNLATALKLIHKKQLDPAEQLIKSVLEKSPLNAEGWGMLGDVLLAKGKYQDALNAYQKSASIRQSAESLLGMADAAAMLDDLQSAENYLKESIKINPKIGIAHYNLAFALQSQMKNPEYAIKSLENSIALGTRVEESYALMGDIAQDQLNNRNMARTAYLKSLDASPGNYSAMIGLARLYWSNSHIDEAMKLLNQLIDNGEDNAGIYQLISSSFLRLGKHQECLAMYKKALELAPNDLKLFSSYLFSTNYSDILSEQEWFLEHQRYGEKINSMFEPIKNHPEIQINPEKKLRIGYVSGDLSYHSVAFFFEPVMEKHNREHFEIYCYYTRPNSDFYTERFKKLSDGWRDVQTLKTKDLAAQILADKIDILVDLSGHTDLERLDVFAMKPAPLQFTWLGYVATTGMSRIDYIFTDKYYTPNKAAEKSYTEKPVYLPVYRVFRPEAELEIRPLPALENGYITFGSFNNFLKINKDVLQLWAELLLQIPNARLSIIVSAKGAADYVTEFFTSRGVAKERLLIFNKLDKSRFLQLHWHVDIALDPFPFNGATTSFDGLWMGVPMISMMSSRIVSRSGYSLLGPLGLEEFVVHTPEEYIEKAKYWAGNIEKLAEIRSGLRDRLKKSPLIDAAEFTRNFENVFRTCWREWCEKQVVNSEKSAGK